MTGPDTRRTEVGRTDDGDGSGTAEAVIRPSVARHHGSHLPGAPGTAPAVPGQAVPNPAIAPDAGAAPPPPPTALVVTVSTRAAAGVYPDRSGPILVARLAALGFRVDGPVVVPDGEAVLEVLRRAVATPYDVVLTTGGTGLTPTDRTPEMTRAVLDREVPGIAEVLRVTGHAKLPTAALSRGVAGVAGRTLVVNLPGSVGGVRDGMDVLDGLLLHAVDQIGGGDHTGPHGTGPHHGGPRGEGPRSGDGPGRSH